MIGIERSGAGAPQGPLCDSPSAAFGGCSLAQRLRALVTRGLAKIFDF